MIRRGRVGNDWGSAKAAFTVISYTMSLTASLFKYNSDGFLTCSGHGGHAIQ